MQWQQKAQTKPIQYSAWPRPLDNFLAALDAAGRQKAVIDFADSTERENWHYIPRERAGLPLKEMDERQRQLAHALVATGVSASGYEKVSTIISLEPILAELEGSRAALPARSRAVLT